MRVYKGKIDKTRLNEVTEIPSDSPTGYCVCVQSVWYSSTNPSHEITLLDGDGDVFMRTLSGQGVEGTPNPYVLDTPVTVKLPLKCADSGEGNTVIVYGEAYRMDHTLESSF